MVRWSVLAFTDLYLLCRALQSRRDDGARYQGGLLQLWYGGFELPPAEDGDQLRTLASL